MSVLKAFWLLYLVKGMREVRKKCRLEVCREEKVRVGSSIFSS